MFHDWRDFVSEGAARPCWMITSPFLKLMSVSASSRVGQGIQKLSQQVANTHIPSAFIVLFHSICSRIVSYLVPCRLRGSSWSLAFWSVLQSSDSPTNRRCISCWPKLTLMPGIPQNRFKEPPLIHRLPSPTQPSVPSMLIRCCGCNPIPKLGRLGTLGCSPCFVPATSLCSWRLLI